MNKRILIIGALIVVLTLLFGPLGMAGARPAMDLEDDIETSILAGLDWLAAQQNGDGSWGSDCYVAHTGLVVLKLETRAYELGYEDPLDPAYEYSDHIAAGLDYIMLNAYHEVAALGDPDGNENGYRAFFFTCSPTYETGIAMMALSASGHPALYLDFVQDAVDWMAWAQNDDTCGLHSGGWGYGANDCSWSDNSNAGYATLGLGFAQAGPPFGFGLTIPAFVAPELSIWIDVLQNDVDGNSNEGGSIYNPNWGGSDWYNILKTGNLLYEMGLTGDDDGVTRVMDAVDFIERHWADDGGCSAGWKDDTQAMFTMMKGFESLGIEFIDLDDDDISEHEWFPEVAGYLVLNQHPDGYWNIYCRGNNVLATVWALLTLEKSVPVFEIPVAFDIHPGSCPNPLNVDKKGVTPAAIAGTESFDVTQVDLTSLLLKKATEDDFGVSPLRTAYEDVAIPYDFEEEWARYSCLEYYEGDGFLDLTLKFSTQEIADLLSVLGVSDGDELLLYLTGNLTEEYGGAPIVGQDVVWIIEK